MNGDVNASDFSLENTDVTKWNDDVSMSHLDKRSEDIGNNDVIELKDGVTRGRLEMDSVSGNGLKNYKNIKELDSEHISLQAKQNGGKENTRKVPECETTLEEEDVTEHILDKKDEEKHQYSQGPPWFKSKRYILSFILFGGILNIYLQRANLNITIVCMVNHTATNTEVTVGKNLLPIASQLHSEYTSSDSDGFVSNNTRDHHGDDQPSTVYTTDGGMSRTDSCVDIDEKETEDGPLNWDKKTQGLVLGSIYWTYMLLTIPSDAVVSRFSKKRTISLSMLMMTGVNMLIPVAAPWSPWAVFAIKLVQGVCTPLSILSIYGMLGNWSPPPERTFLISFTFTGAMFSNAIVFPISGYLCKYGFLGGWPSVFYVFGFYGILWTAVFAFMSAESPEVHSSITAEERTYIQTSLSNTLVTEKPQTPWRALLRPPPVWAIVFLNFSYTWGLFLLTSTLPQYMKEVLKFKIDSNGLYTMLPYLVMLLFGSTSGQVSTWIIRRDVIRLVWVRKIGAIIGNFLPALFLLIASFQDCTQSTMAVFLITLAVGLSGVTLSVILSSPFDIAPAFAQTITALATVFAAGNGIITPYVVAAITKDKTKSQWQTVFFLSSGMMVMGTVVYCILGRADRQPWAVAVEEKEVKRVECVGPSTDNGGQKDIDECAGPSTDNGSQKDIDEDTGLLV